MGGLSKGEVASCKVIRALENWFTEEFSLMQGMNEDVREYKGVSLNAFYNPSTSYIGMLT